MQQEQKPRAYILNRKYRAQRTNQIFSSESWLSDVLPPARSYNLNIPNSATNWRQSIQMGQHLRGTFTNQTYFSQGADEPNNVQIRQAKGEWLNQAVLWAAVWLLWVEHGTLLH